MNMSFHDSPMISVTSGRNWPQMTAALLVIVIAGFAPNLAISGQFSEENDGSSGWTRTSNPPVNRREFDVQVAQSQQDTDSPTTASTNSRGLVIPVIVLGVSQAADWHSTKIAIARGHREGNPFMDVGDNGRMVAKIGASIAIAYVSHRIARRHPKVAKGLVWTASAVTFAVAARNYSIVR